MGPRLRRARRDAAAAVLLFGVVLGGVAGAEEDRVTGWIRARAREHAAHLRGLAAGRTPPVAGQLWRERPANLPLPELTPQLASLAPLIRAVSPGVVNISTVNARGPSPRGGGALGSGFILGPEGHVVTNSHVVERAEQIQVRLGDGREFLADVVGRDPSTDVALLLLRGGAGELPFVYLGDSDKLEVGDWVLAIGNPFGLDHSVSHGLISAKERVIGIGPLDDFLQTDVLINPGNSGGPLFNMRGEVIGVNTAIVSQGQGIGFAVPINMVKEMLPNLRVNGRLARGWLGVTIFEQEVGAGRKGAVVKDVHAGSPAALAGIRPGDRLVSVNGRPIESYPELLRQVAFLAPGVEVRLSLLRGGSSREVSVKLGERPAGEALQPVASPPAANEALGLAVRDLPQEQAGNLGLRPFSGVLVTAVAPGSAGERAGLRPGDLITEVNRRGVQDARGFKAALARSSPEHGALIRFQRGDQVRYVAVGP